MYSVCVWNLHFIRPIRGEDAEFKRPLLQTGGYGQVLYRPDVDWPDLAAQPGEFTTVSVPLHSDGGQGLVVVLELRAGRLIPFGDLGNFYLDNLRFR